MSHDLVFAPRQRPRLLRHAGRMLLGLLVVGVLSSAAPGLALAAAGPTPEPVDTAVSWGVRPTDAEQGSGRPNFNYEVAVGSTLADSLTVTNYGDEALALDVYAADGFLTPDGSLDILPSGEASSELGSWIALDGDAVTLAVGESAEIPFELTVPADIQPGDYAAGIVAAMRVESETGVVTERRLGSRVLVRVAGDLVPAVTVSDVTIDHESTLNPLAAGAATVTFTIRNTGNTRIDPDATVTVSGPFGVAPLRVGAGDVPELLPGTTIERVVEVADVYALGVLTAEVDASGTVVERPGSEASQLPVVAPASGSSTVVAIPWVALGILLLIIALIVWRIVARRRSRRAHRREIDEAVAAALSARASADPSDAPAADAVGTPAGATGGRP